MQVRRDGAEKETAQFGFRRALAGARGERVSTIVEALGLAPKLALCASPQLAGAVGRLQAPIFCQIR
jgi:hypothetical protein